MADQVRPLRPWVRAPYFLEFPSRRGTTLFQGRHLCAKTLQRRIQLVLSLRNDCPPSSPRHSRSLWTPCKDDNRDHCAQWRPVQQANHDFPERVCESCRSVAGCGEAIAMSNPPPLWCGFPPGQKISSCPSQEPTGRSKKINQAGCR